jgi:hypothetical protein
MAANFYPASRQAYSYICLNSSVRASGWGKLGLTVLAVAAAAKLIDSVDSAPARAPPKPEPTFEIVCGNAADLVALFVRLANYAYARSIEISTLCSAYCSKPCLNPAPNTS